MRRLLCPAVALLALTLGSGSIAQSNGSKVLIFVKVPADAELTVDGVKVKQTGEERRLITPPIPQGEQGLYTLKAVFKRDGKSVTVERDIVVEGGKVTQVDLRDDEPKAGDATASDTRSTERPSAGKSETAGQPTKADPPAKKAEVAKDPEVRLDVPFVATPESVVEEMLKMAGVKDTDVVYDLGCGDGRIVVTAVKKFKAKRGLGIDIDPKRVKMSKENAEKAGVADKVQIRQGDVLKINDVSEASVVTLYLLPEVNEQIKPMLRRTLKPGARVVSHDFDMGEDWKPDKEVTVKDEEGREHTVYLWTIPERAAPKKDEPAPAPKKADDKKDEPTIKVPYVPTPQSVVEEMLKLGGVKEGDVVYDLGCGDGRIVITAVKSYKAKRGVGVDIDPERIDESKKKAKDAGVEQKVEFREGDVLKITDVSDANVVCLYLFPEVNERLKPMLRRTLKPGSRVVSHDFLMGDDWKPEKEVTVTDATGQEHTLYLWTIKEKQKE
jgi:uncharacterized protein (TIGR03000 family)